MTESLDELVHAELEPRLMYEEEKMRALPISNTQGVELLVGFLEWLGVSNAERLPQNGVLDEQVEAALAEVRVAHADLLRNEIKAIALVTGDFAVNTPDTFNQESRYTDFLQRLKERAANEKVAEFAVAVRGDAGWPSTRAIG